MEERNINISVLLFTLLLFIVASFFLVRKAEHFSTVIFFIALLTVFKHNANYHINELNNILFTKKDLIKIKLIENLGLSFLFVVILLSGLKLYFAFTTLAFSLIISFIKLPKFNSFTLPTPFYKNPFEYLIGFRKYFPLLIIIFTITVISYLVDNYNLGIACILFLYLTLSSFYFFLEEKFYVWIFDYDSKEFLFKKLKTGLKYSFVLSTPIWIYLFSIYPKMWYITLMFLIIGNLYLTISILLKYSNYPHQMEIIWMLVYITGIFLPPILLFILPFVFRQAVKSLNLIFNDCN